MGACPRPTRAELGDQGTPCLPPLAQTLPHRVDSVMACSPPTFGVNSPPSNRSEPCLTLDVFLASDHLPVGLGLESWPEIWCECTWLFGSKTAEPMGCSGPRRAGGHPGGLEMSTCFSPTYASPETQPRATRQQSFGQVELGTCHPLRSATNVPVYFISGVWCVMARGAY